MTYSADLADVVEDVLAAIAAEAAGAGAWPRVTSLDWHLVGLPEAAGGAGGGLADQAEIARHGLGIPLVTTWLANWLEASHGNGRLRNPGASRTISFAGEAGLSIDVRESGQLEVSGCVELTAGWDKCDRCLIIGAEPGAGGSVLVDLPVEPGDFSVLWRRPGPLGDSAVGARLSGAGSSTATATRTSTTPSALQLQATARYGLYQAAALTGAAARACAWTVQHVTSRQQFGRPLARNQAVQQGIAAMAAERELMVAAVTRAVQGGGSDEAAIAAMAVASRGSGAIAERAHQLHGAIGITQEHPLHASTLRLWGWRDIPRTQRWWEEKLGRLVEQRGEEWLWELVVASEEESPP